MVCAPKKGGSKKPNPFVKKDDKNKKAPAKGKKPNPFKK